MKRVLLITITGLGFTIQPQAQEMPTATDPVVNLIAMQRYVTIYCPKMAVNFRALNSVFDDMGVGSLKSLPQEDLDKGTNLSESWANGYASRESQCMSIYGMIGPKGTLSPHNLVKLIK